MIQETSLVESPELIAESVSIWHYSHVRAGSTIGAGTVIGRNVYIGPAVSIGKNCKVQNFSLIYDPAVVADGVFIGPGVIFTNDKSPRAINPDKSLKGTHDWSPVGVTVEFGASIGAGSICVAPVRIGQWAMIAAGSVVVTNVPSYALFAGCPAKQIGWVGEDGLRLLETESGFISETLHTRYELVDGVLEAIVNQ